MGFLESLIGTVIRLICGGGDQQQQQQPGTAAGTHPSPPGQYPPPQQQHGQYPRPPGQQGPRPPHQQHQQPQHQRPPGGAGKPSSPPGRKPGHYEDLNRINQANPFYTDLRARANRAGDAMSRAFDDAHAAHSRGEGARAKELSNEGRKHQREMEELNRQASEWIFQKNNEDSGPHEVDLHGLYVKEAITHTDRAIEDARRRGDTEVHLIVGKGLHSKGGVAKLKPAIEDLMQKHRLVAALDPNNAGVLIVHLDGGARGGERAMGSDDITRNLERNDGGCIIM